MIQSVTKALRWFCFFGFFVFGSDEVAIEDVWLEWKKTENNKWKEFVECGVTVGVEGLRRGFFTT